MRILVQIVCGALLCASVAAQDYAAHPQGHSVTLVTGLGDIHHPVSTDVI